MKLSDIALVRSGLVLSRKQAREPSEIRYPLLTLRSINSTGYIDHDQVDVFDATEHLSPEYLTQVGDVIVRLTAPYTAVLIDKSSAGMVISSNFVLIRAAARRILPEYLFWLLNTQEVKRAIFENSSGNMIGAIKAKYFSEFELVPLPIEEQQILAAINTLALREAKLLQELADAKAHYHSLIIDRVYQDMKRGS